MGAVLRLLRFARPYPWHAVGSLLLLLVVVVIDLAIPRLVQHTIDFGVAKNDPDTVFQTAGMMLGLTLLGLAIAVGNSVLSVVTGELFARDLRAALFTRVQQLSFPNLDQLQTGPLIVRLTSDVQQVQQFFQIMLRIGTRGPLLMAGSLVLLFSTSPQLALWVLPLLILNVVALVWFVGRMQSMFAVTQEKLDRLNNTLQENIAGVRVVKAFVRAAHEAVRFGSSNDALFTQSTRAMELLAFLMPTVSILLNLGAVVVVWVGGVRAIHGQLSVGEIIAFTNYLLTCMMPLMIMAMIAASLAGAGASAKRVEEVLLSEPAIKDPVHPQSLPDPGTPPHGATIQFEHVTFRYAANVEEPVLRDISFTIPAGQTVALLGSTGAGKTSLVQLVPRFYDATQGRVLVDGVDVTYLAQDDLLAQVGMVMQESVLFTGKVLDNIRYGRPDAGMEDVVAAAKAAQAHGFITALPQGYDSMVSERGGNLSGGQKQRIALARALLLKPRILILDDSTSSVDVETERLIQDAMQSLHNGCTTLVVAQRISTVLNADRILVLDRGTIVADGAHAQLLASSPIYREIHASQLGPVDHV